MSSAAAPFVRFEPGSRDETTEIQGAAFELGEAPQIVDSAFESRLAAAAIVLARMTADPNYAPTAEEFSAVLGSMSRPAPADTNPGASAA